MIELTFQTFLTLLVVMDPVGLAPIFLGLAGLRSAAERMRMARKAVLVAGVVILLFALFGTFLLEKLGITIAAFKASGGILLFLIALDMIFARLSGAKETNAEEQEAKLREDISVFPIAIPLIAGPGTLTSVMILIGQANSIQAHIAVIGTAFLVLVLCYVALRVSSAMVKLIGVTGVNVVSRVLGVLLAALAVQYVADGVKTLFGLL